MISNHARERFMSAVPEPVTQDEYELIEAAVMETARGRWFLAEHARRERAAERAQLLFSMKRLERVAEENLDLLRFQAAAEEMSRKLDEVLRHVQSSARLADEAHERRLIEQRLIEPRSFLK